MPRRYFYESKCITLNNILYENFYVLPYLMLYKTYCEYKLEFHFLKYKCFYYSLPLFFSLYKCYLSLTFKRNQSCAIALSFFAGNLLIYL